jgi:hypothetical protein
MSWPGLVTDLAAMADERLRHLLWRVVDELDYLLTLTRLRLYSPAAKGCQNRTVEPGSAAPVFT